MNMAQVATQLHRSKDLSNLNRSNTQRIQPSAGHRNENEAVTSAREYNQSTLTKKKRTHDWERRSEKETD